ncbi:MAG TPA: DUF2127 domain-containing protein [Candidatus Paceibacterota bacterium]|nr:DUF2127 domain-containing protein [Candidatus Paceibacterota bacterium]
MAIINRKSEERGLHDLFEIGIAIKGIDGIIELAGGIFLYFASHAMLVNMVLFLAHGELLEDPRDWFVNLLLHTAQNFSPQAQWFASALLMVHGAVKIFLVAGLLKNKLWAYPASIVIFTGFAVYQFYQLTYGYSLFLWSITIVDIIVVGLIIHEYLHVKKTDRFIKTK